MPYEAQVIDELEKYFRSIGLKTERNKHNYYYDKGFKPLIHSYVEVDLVIQKDNIKIPIEVKTQVNTDSIYKGIGQALSNLIFYDESWLAIPDNAIELLTHILKKIKFSNLKIFDWENKVLYGYENGEVIGNKL
jgi:hypothetical protein